MEKPPQIRIGEFTVALLSDGIWTQRRGLHAGRGAARIVATRASGGQP